MLKSKIFRTFLLLLALVVAFFLPALVNAQEESTQELVSGKVNVNTANVEQLRMLYRVGEVIAQRIIDEREANGPYKDLQDFSDRVKGIGEKTAACNASSISFDGDTTLTQKVVCKEES